MILKRAIFILLVVCSLCGCKKSTEQASSLGYDPSAAFASIESKVIAPAYQRFHASTVTLEAAVGVYSAAIASGSATPQQLDDAREAWRATMRAWQETEVYQVGPAGAATDTIGGRDLRDEIYSWPITNSCRVDQETVEAVYGDAGFFEAESVNVYGLDALEYLLFTDSLDNTCSPVAAINEGPWAGLDDAEKTRRRAAYAHAISTQLVSTASALSAQWAEGGEFSGQLSGAGDEGSVYPTTLAALDDLLAAMLYLDFEVKDDKLGKPAQLLAGACTEATCPEALESQWAKHSKAQIASNLFGFRSLFLGGSSPDDVGFDDLLRELGFGALADSILADTDAAISAVEAIEGPLADALTADLDGVKAAHAAIKKLTDQLKGEFVTVLKLQLPAEGASDND